MSEAELVGLAQAGDEAAWEGLVCAHQEAVFRLAYLLVGEPSEAEDIAQEAFLRAFRALARFDRSRPLRPWLLTIAANLARNRQRSIRRALAAVRRLVQAEPQALVAPPEVTSVRAGEAEALWQAIRRLSRSDQEILYLRYFLELPEAETAEVLGLARGTVKSRLHRALGRLRDVVTHDFPILMEGRDEQRIG